MPELPEVETVKNTLSSVIINKTIKCVDVYYNKIIQNVDVNYFKTKLENQTFRKIDRCGKYLIMYLDDYIIVSHLRMEGRYYYKEISTKEKHEHIIFTFTNGFTLRYIDTRKFGTMHLFNITDDIYNMYPLNTLGIDANSNDVTKQYLKDKLTKYKGCIKKALLEQSILSGIGNIYADEIIFMSKLHPLDLCKKLTDDDIENIIRSSKTVLNKAINLGGTTIKSFESSHNITGRFQNELLVHTKQICPNCNNKITKITVHGRGTYICTNCQKKKNQKIAITGSIACGKSEAINYLKSLGLNIIETDKLVHLLYEDKKVINIIKNTFNDVITEGKVDRKKLAKIIFTDNNEKIKLENIIHPMIRNIIAKQTNTVFVEIPLLFESHMEDLFDVIICITVDTNTQIDRLMKRNNITKEDALVLINSQMKKEDKEKLSDYVIYNSEDICTLQSRIDEIIKKII